MKLFPAIIGIFLCGCSGQAEGVSSASVTAPPPLSKSVSGDQRWEPVFTDIEGQQFRPLDSGAKAIVLVFVLQDCPIANSYMPELNRLHESFAHRSIPLVIIETDPQISPDQAKEHAQQYEIKPPVVLDAQHRWVQLFGATKTPESVVVSPTGEVLYRGRIDDKYVALGKQRMQVATHDLQDALDDILANRPVQHPATTAIGCFIPELPKSH